MFHRLPSEIIREHIMPYTYSPQSSELCLDVRSFVETRKKLFCYYIKNLLISPHYGDYSYKNDNIKYGFYYFFSDLFNNIHNSIHPNKDEIIQFMESLPIFPIPKNLNIQLAGLSIDQRILLIHYSEEIELYSLQ